MLHKERVILVTGASRGIGASIAQYFIEHNAYVVGTATSIDGAQKLSDLFGNNGHGEVLDVTNQQSINELFDKLKSINKLPDILVNNAGITKDNLSMRMSNSDWECVISTNLTSAFLISKACMRHMMKKKMGKNYNYRFRCWQLRKSWSGKLLRIKIRHYWNV